MDVHIDVIFSFLTLIFSFSVAQSTFVDDSDCFYRVENSLVVFADALAELVATHFFKHAKSFAAIFSFKFLFKLDFFHCRFHMGIFFLSKVVNLPCQQFIQQTPCVLLATAEFFWLGKAG